MYLYFRNGEVKINFKNKKMVKVRYDLHLEFDSDYLVFIIYLVSNNKFIILLIKSY